MSDHIMLWETLKAIHKDVKRIQRTLDAMSEDIRAEFDDAVTSIQETVSDETEEVKAVVVLDNEEKQGLRDQVAALQTALDNAQRNALTPTDIATLKAVKQTIQNIHDADGSSTEPVVVPADSGTTPTEPAPVP